MKKGGHCHALCDVIHRFHFSVGAICGCICSYCETLSLSLSVCYCSLKFPAILTADLKPSQPEPFSRAEHHRRGQSDNIQLK